MPPANPSSPPTGNTRDSIRRVQLDQLRQLIGTLSANRFYRVKWEAAGVSGVPSDLADYARRYPVTTKAELVADQAAHPPYGTNLTYPLERYTRFHQTSGTSGQAVRWLDTPESWETLVAGWREVFRAAGVHAGDRVLFAFTFGPFIGFWMAFEAAVSLGCLCLPGGGLSSAARLHLLLENRATVLCCTPTYAARLAEAAEEEGIDLRDSTIRVLMVAGEPGGSIPATRARLEALWRGARVFDHHGMTEVGPVTYECPMTPGRLHVIERQYLAEILDLETGAPVAEGRTGELVLTTLCRAGSPLLRYRTGDLVRPIAAPERTDDAACRCGRAELALDGGILGRVDDMLIVRGVNLFPSGIEAVIRQFPEVAEFRMEVGKRHELTELSISIEPFSSAVPGETLARRVQKALQDAFALRIPVRTVAPGSLPRFEMKARRMMRDPRPAVADR